MKGALYISETFMKILTTGYLVLLFLAVFITLNEYQLIYLENTKDRETFIIGDAVLSSCITEVRNYDIVKGLLSEEEIKKEINSNPNSISNISCLSYDKGIYVDVLDENENVLYGFGNSTLCKTLNPCEKKDWVTYTILPAALKRTSSVIPVTLKVYVGV